MTTMIVNGTVVQQDLDGYANYAPEADITKKDPLNFYGDEETNDWVDDEVSDNEEVKLTENEKKLARGPAPQLPSEKREQEIAAAAAKPTFKDLMRIRSDGTVNGHLIAISTHSISYLKSYVHGAKVFECISGINIVAARKMIFNYENCYPFMFNDSKMGPRDWKSLRAGCEMEIDIIRFFYEHFDEETVNKVYLKDLKTKVNYFAANNEDGQINYMMFVTSTPYETLPNDVKPYAMPVEDMNNIPGITTLKNASEKTRHNTGNYPVVHEFRSVLPNKSFADIGIEMKLPKIKVDSTSNTKPVIEEQKPRPSYKNYVPSSAKPQQPIFTGFIAPNANTSQYSSYQSQKEAPKPKPKKPSTVEQEPMNTNPYTGRSTRSYQSPHYNRRY